MAGFNKQTNTRCSQRACYTRILGIHGKIMPIFYQNFIGSFMSSGPDSKFNVLLATS